jgi:hypothetical protein
MDVHPPHHPIGNWRDFFLHIVTITVGLLIALSLEALVEYAHHREVVERARQTLRAEMEENRRVYSSDLAGLDADLGRQGQNLVLARQLAAGTSGLDGQFHSSFQWSSFSSSAWQTARDTGALGWMPYTEVERLDSLYVQQGLVNTAAVQVFTLQTQAAAPIVEQGSLDQLSAEERSALLRQTAQLTLELKALRQMLEPLGPQLEQAAAPEHR